MNAFNVQARRLERAQALQNERLNAAAGGLSMPVGGGFAHFRGAGHPLNQALGLVDPISEAELHAVERFLGNPTVLELCPSADPELWALLARRGYRLHQFQQMWVRSVTGTASEAAPPDVQIRIVGADEAPNYNRLVAAGFMDQDDWRTVEPPFVTPLGVPDVFGFILAVRGEPAGGGLLGVVEGVALLSGDSVLPQFRGRGLQTALVRARLKQALVLGCDIACASTAPSTASQMNYQKCGFRVAYPKVELARG